MIRMTRTARIYVGKFWTGFWIFAVAVWIVAIVATSVFGNPPLTITEGGYFLTVVGDDGVPSHVKLTTVIDLRDGGNQPPPNPPEFDLELVKKVQAWAEENKDPIASQALAAVYSQVRGAFEDGILDRTTVWPALKAATEAVLPIVDSGKDWTPFRDKLTAVLTERTQRGTLQTDPQINLLLISTQQGLELSADGSDAIGLDVMVQISKVTNEAIDAAK